jgi:FKBP-type peptidyl-prolyl cis-trans isomerase FkpA
MYKMKKLLMFSFIFSLFGACSKDVTPEEQLAIDTDIIKKYIADNKLTAQSTPESVYYVLDNAGTGTAFPAPSSRVMTYYKGYFTDGTVFDNGGGKILEIGLYEVITGWTIGMQKFKKGQKGKLLIPSGLGYGPSGRGGIPANSVLIFDIEMVDFK